MELLESLAGGAPADPAAAAAAKPLPVPRLTQLLLRHVPTAADDETDDSSGSSDGGDGGEGKDAAAAGGVIGPALAAMIERRAERGAEPLERLAGVWRLDAASLSRILRVTLPSLRWLEIGGGACVRACVRACALPCVWPMAVRSPYTIQFNPDTQTREQAPPSTWRPSPSSPTC